MKKQTKSAVNAGFVQGAAILGIAGLLVKIIGAVYRIPLANIVGESGMAYYEVAYPYYSWLLVISSAGLPTAISKLVSERIALGKTCISCSVALAFCHRNCHCRSSVCSFITDRKPFRCSTGKVFPYGIVACAALCVRHVCLPRVSARNAVHDRNSNQPDR